MTLKKRSLEKISWEKILHFVKYCFRCSNTTYITVITLNATQVADSHYIYQNSVYSLAFCKFQPPPAQNMVRGLELLYALGGKSFSLECGDLSSIFGPVYLLNFILTLSQTSPGFYVSAVQVF